MIKSTLLIITAIAGISIFGMPYVAFAADPTPAGPVPTPYPNVGTEKAAAVPDWVKNQFRWYVNEEIDEKTLLTSLNWMFDNNIMHLSEKSAKQVKELRMQNEQLKQKLASLSQYKTDSESGNITFGDGERGKVPSTGSTQTPKTDFGSMVKKGAVDDLGRIKVNFPFDETDKEQVASFVAEIYAEKVHKTQSTGTVWIPVIEDEVLVSFENGDPDKPIIVGRVYNSEMMPPYKLSDGKTVPGIKIMEDPNQMKFDDSLRMKTMHQDMANKMHSAINHSGSEIEEFERMQNQLAKYHINTSELSEKIQKIRDAKQALREDISELRDIISNDRWPTKFSYSTQTGNTGIVLDSAREAAALLDKLETSLQTMGDDEQLHQMDLQNLMQKQSQMMQIMSNMMKNQHDTLKAIIQNMK